VRVNKLSKHMYSAQPTLLTDTLAHIKPRGEGTQRRGRHFRPDLIIIALNWAGTPK